MRCTDCGNRFRTEIDHVTPRFRYGPTSHPEELMTNPNVSDWVHDLTDELIWLAAGWPVGTVLERRGEIVLPRTLSDENV